MKGVILAAGRGTRLLPLTATCPKPMLPIAGRPLLEHVIRLLVAHGIDDLYINLHHLPESIRTYCGDGTRWGARIQYSHEPVLLGTAGAVRRLSSRLGNAPFLVYYADNLTNFDLHALYRAHVRAGAAATLGLLWMDEPSTRGIVGLDEDGRIDRLIEKPRPGQVFADYLVNAGTYILEPEVITHIPASGYSDFAHHVFPALLGRGVPLYGYSLRGQLLSTDTPERYAQAQACVASGAFETPGRLSA